MKKAKPNPPKADVYPIVSETFVKPWGLNNDERFQKPSVFNGSVYVRKYRITIELVDEPIEVIRERIQKLYDESRNYHDHEPLRREGKLYGMEWLQKRSKP